ncbi:MAG: hypothetical protein RMI56_04555 [Sulfolobales archaeon]|nr:hypothetical protein [Sulfolobales archaeon]
MILELVYRFKFVLPLAALAALILAPRSTIDGLSVRIAYDYSIWFSTVLTALAAYLDLKNLGWLYSYRSTLTITLAGAALAILGRLASLVINTSLYVPYEIMPLLGSRYTYESFTLSLVAVSTGTSLVLVSTMVHAVTGRPLATFGGRPLNESLVRLWNMLLITIRSSSWLYLLISFSLGFTLRLVPEIIWWPWHVGWDTVEYVAHLMDFLENPNPFRPYHWMGGLRNCPPMLNLILALPAHLLGAWAVFKIYPAVAYGLLAASSALLARKAFKLDGLRSLAASSVTALFILNLRISWDYQRQLLGSVFMLLALAFLDDPEGEPRRRAAVAALLLISSALSHEVTGFFAVAASLAFFAHSLLRREWWGTTSGLASLATSAALEIWYWGSPYSDIPSIGRVPPGLVSQPATSAPEVFSYLFAGLGVVLPLTILALADQRQGAAFCAVALATLTLAGLSPALAPYTSVALWYRFLIGAAPVASTLAGVYLAKQPRAPIVQLTYLAILASTSLPFTLSILGAVPYGYSIREFPVAGLTPLPFDRRLLEDLSEIAEEVKKWDRETPIVAPDWVARWVHLSVRNPPPGKLIWLWPKLNSTILDELKHLELEKAYVITTLETSDIENIKVKPIWKGRMLQAYFIESIS